MPTLRIHRGDLTSTPLLGRGVGVDRLPVGSLSDDEVTELTIPAGTHILQIRNGLYFSRATRYTAVEGEVLDYELRMCESSGWLSLLGDAIELRRLPRAAVVVQDERGLAPISRVYQTVTVNP